jgi:hypothetical protein
VNELDRKLSRGHPLTDEEQRVFFRLLRRVCENHVDQWLMMRIETSGGPFFIDISLGPAPGVAADEYALVDPDSRLGDHWRTGAAMDEERRRRESATPP